MKVYSKYLKVPRLSGGSLIQYFKDQCEAACSPTEIPLRFIVTKTDDTDFHCELDVFESDHSDFLKDKSIFSFTRRDYEEQTKFNAVLVIPTGINAQLGGHAGDANALARYLSSACDTLITHSNVVNASDINEMPENCLYVEGSVVSRFLMGEVGLRPVRKNRLLLLMDDHKEELVKAQVVNAASAARCTLGAEVKVVSINNKAKTSAHFSESGRAVGEIDNLAPSFRYLREHRNEYDAVALASVVDFPEEVHQNYLAAEGEMVNPWGGAEAMLTHSISHYFDFPSAHAPMMVDSETTAELADVVDPRMAAEELSSAFIHCVLKGLQKSPQIVTDKQQLNLPNVYSAKDVSCLIIPDKCIGLPTLAAVEQGIPVIAVKENENIMSNQLEDLAFQNKNLIVVENYLEAAGAMLALRSSLSLESIRRPIPATEVKDY